jgi:hypothetical protein
MRNEQVKKTIEAIINDGSGMIYTDDGSGSGGPGYADGDTLREMMDRGDFDDAVVVEMDEALARDSFAGQCEYDEDTEWTQIEYGYGDNNYRRIGWIWDA